MATLPFSFSASYNGLKSQYRKYVTIKMTRKKAIMIIEGRIEFLKSK
jgi:hypothetical protein